MSKEWIWTLIGTVISWSLGYFGADRFYRGDVGLGVLKLITLGGLGVWWIIEACVWTYRLGQASAVEK